MLFLLLALLFGRSVQAQPVPTIPIYLFELKPLIYMGDNKQIQGKWYDSFQKLSKKAGVNFDYMFVSIPRMELLLSGAKPGCNLTLIKSKKRQETIHFIYDHKEKTILKVYQRADDTRKWDIKKLQEDKNVRIITNTSVGMDTLNKQNIKTDLLFNVSSIIHMLLIKRIDIYVGSNLAVEKMEEFKSKKLKAGMVIETITHGIGCSRGTPDIITEKIKKAAKTWDLEGS